jgi:Ca2+-binding EF-hand superfamily protein
MSSGFTKAEVTKAFKLIDKDNSNTICGKEVEDLLRKVYGPKGDPKKISEEAAAFLTDVDKNHDGKITLEEFLKFFKCS